MFTKRREEKKKKKNQGKCEIKCLLVTLSICRLPVPLGNFKDGILKLKQSEIKAINSKKKR
jgi:hypothetical protein